MKADLFWKKTNELDSSFENEEIMFSNLGYLVSIALDPTYQKDDYALYRIEDILSC